MQDAIQPIIDREVIEMVVDWIVAVGTIAVAVIAVFQDWIRSWLTRPKLQLSVDTKPPDCLKTPLVRRDKDNQPVATSSAYQLRLKVTNKGNAAAEIVEVFATDLSRKEADGVFRPVDSFLPMNLRWSHYQTVWLNYLSPDMPKHCDLGRIIDPQMRSEFEGEDRSWPNVSPDSTILSLSTIDRPFIQSYLLPRGIYHLGIRVAASNARPISATLEISLPGQWYEDENEMLGQGIGIKVL